MQYAKPKVYWLMLIGVIFSILNISTSYAAPSCPNDDKMYYVGNNAPAGSTSLPLSWTSGNLSKTFTFSDNTTLNLSFTGTQSLISDADGSPPFYVTTANSYSNVGAIALQHSSNTAPETNHTLNMKVNGDITQAGFVIQDLDSARDRTYNYYVVYQEEADVSSTGGQLTSNATYHNINASKNIVTSIAGQNCPRGGCNIDATWRNKTANSTLSLTHSNQAAQRPNDGYTHAISYSDFYFCVKPASYTITKDDGVTSVVTGTNTTYTIKVTNTGGTTLNNLVLTDPAVTGLTKLSGISCDSNDTANTCSSTSLPTIAQLQGSGYTISSLAAGKSYSIKVPVNVTAAAGSSVTNIATISGGGLTSQSAADTDSVTSVFGGGVTPTPAICPGGDRMYYVGKSAPSDATALDLTWTAGNTSKTFTFPDGTTMKINFPLLVDRNNTYAGISPFVGNITGATSGALNLVHNSPAMKNNHQMDITINQNVSQFGYNIQDLDSTGTTSIPYVEQVDVSSTSGKLTYYDTYHKINLTNDIVTAKNGQNCSLNACTISATWGKKLANSTFSLVHSNEYTQYDAVHVVGYSDFYFCLSPPKLITQKALNGTRARSSDQFTIATTGGTVNNSFTTGGTGSTIDAGTNRSSVIALTSGTSATYTITESIANSGSLTNYNTTYKCTNGTTSTSTMPSGNGSSFSLSNLNYGDEITCQVTNAPKAYTFSGIVFNDNGGLTLANDLSVPVGTNTTYFNGVYDSSVETGITQASLTIDLAKNCNTTTPTIIQSAPVGSDGTYSISATSTQMANATNVCLIQREPNGNLTSYPVDTTNNQANITFASTTYDYQNINFGEVSQNNAGLVLVKEQATNDCNISIATMLGLNYVKTQQDAIDARKCVAYKITAYNRTNLTNGLTDVKITDALPKKGVNGSTVNSLLDNPLDTTLTNFKVDTANSVAIGANGTVVSDVQSLAKGASRSLYFNTKYDANSK